VTAIDRFEEITLVDFEFVAKPGERPDVVCQAAHELRTGRTARLWRDELGARPPYRTDERALFVCFVGNAELSCHLALGWPLPANVLDLSAEFRCVVNGRWAPEGKGLLGALAYYGLDAAGSKHKDAMRDRIIKGWPFTIEEREQILHYCSGDVEAMVRLLPKLLPKIDIDIALHRGEFVAASAHMEHRGVPVDMAVFSKLRDKRAWAAVRDDMVPAIDAQYGVYTKNSAGEWSFNAALFEDYLRRHGIDWPRLETGKLDLKRKTFEAMAKSWPQIEDLRQLRYARDKMRAVKLAIGSDGRNRTVLWPFQSKTGRTQPKAARWVFSPAVWLRSLIKPEPGYAVAYIDYSAAEFMIAGVLSDDRVMIDLYNSGDPYLNFCKRVGAAPPSATKASHRATRDIYKVALLAAQYGISHKSLAIRLGVSELEATELLNQHREQFAQYWSWSDDWLAVALDTGCMRTAFGWTCCTGVTEFNERSLRNWPVQAAGADILRIACIWATRRNISVVAPVHDAVLIEAPAEQIDADVALMREIMRRASRVVLNAQPFGPHELRTDRTIVRYPDRYTDTRGDNLWAHVTGLLNRREQTVPPPVVERKSYG
jgi:hypothetical protein